ncbi:elongation factor P-like protein YeiP [Shewanella sp.]|uniref:elongation factor P-like protein EfpL n=1 Tax=Shewanella sp. TaxID=50422 RepID=UPI000C0CB9F8|nr:elongation factor P-like protein YeiP [Shewanella sp.]MBL4815998.1 elongation factor P-like protein YeiP [Shewanella sp.]MCJ8304108.1 elongation factor P-like protein YeiP [Shewanella sp.]PHQ76813.1 MAG: elongation factor P-like protein YeiP [Shewanella sp.]
MPKASDVKKNTAIEFNNNVYLIRDIERSVPQGRSGGSLYRMRMYDVASGSKLDHTFKADDMISLADLNHHDVTFSYIDGDEYVFMDVEDYTPYHFNKDTIAEELLYITEDTQGLHVLTVDGSPVAIELPSHVDLVIVETDPSIKGASASARTKPATLSTGLTVQVPEYIANGEKIKINTAEQKFMSRSDSKA